MHARRRGRASRALEGPILPKQVPPSWGNSLVKDVQPEGLSLKSAPKQAWTELRKKQYVHICLDLLNNDLIYVLGILGLADIAAALLELITSQ